MTKCQKNARKLLPAGPGTFGVIHARIDQTWSPSEQIWPKSGHCWPNSAKLGATRASLVNIWPILAEFSARRPEISPKFPMITFRAFFQVLPRATSGGQHFGEHFSSICLRRPPRGVAAFVHHFSSISQGSRWKAVGGNPSDTALGCVSRQKFRTPWICLICRRPRLTSFDPVAIRAELQAFDGVLMRSLPGLRMRRSRREWHRERRMTAGLREESPDADRLKDRIRARSLSYRMG